MNSLQAQTPEDVLVNYPCFHSIELSELFEVVDAMRVFARLYASKLHESPADGKVSGKRKSAEAVLWDTVGGNIRFGIRSMIVDAMKAYAAQEVAAALAQQPQPISQSERAEALIDQIHAVCKSSRSFEDTCIEIEDLVTEHLSHPKQPQPGGEVDVTVEEVWAKYASPYGICDDEHGFAALREYGNLREAKAREWRPIATGPHGVWVMVASALGHVMQACWCKDGETGYWIAFNDMRVLEPTHWQPLPTQPTQSPENEK